MDFDLTIEQKRIRDISRKFASEVIAPCAEEMERSGKIPFDIIDQMGSLGMMGIPFPQKYGGRDGDWVSMHLCIEEISRGDVVLGGLLDITTAVIAQEIYTFGTEDQKRKWLIPLTQGKEIGAFGMTEPDAGSDPSSMKTTAVLAGDEWIINGSKQFISFVGMDKASIVIVAAKTKREHNGKATICTIIIPKDAPGFTLGKKHEKMGYNAGDTNEIFFDDCRVPKWHLLGNIEKGFAQHLSVLQTGRITIGAITTGLAQACFDEALNYVIQRYPSQQSLFKSQGVLFKLADMAMTIELSRNMYLKAAWLKDQGRNHTMEGHYAKLFGSEAATKIAVDVMRMIGLNGCLDINPISRIFKAVKLHEITEGTSEIQRLIIARELIYS